MVFVLWLFTSTYAIPLQTFPSELQCRAAMVSTSAVIDALAFFTRFRLACLVTLRSR